MKNFFKNIFTANNMMLGILVITVILTIIMIIYVLQWTIMLVPIIMLITSVVGLITQRIINKFSKKK
jgi:hypothetical protein